MDWEVIGVIIAIVSVGVGLGVLVYMNASDNREIMRSMKKENADAHTKIEDNIKDAVTDVKVDFNRRFDDLKDYIKLAMRVKDDG